MAVAQKLTHGVWKSSTKAPDGTINEFVLRLPGFVASLASVALLGFLMRLWGFPWTGVGAAFLLAMHPWHVRYGIEARGYTFVVLLTISGMGILTVAEGHVCRSKLEACATARLRRIRRQAGSLSYGPMWLWWAFGLNQALIVWSHLFSVWVCAARPRGMVPLAESHGRRTPARFCRLVVANVAAAGLLFNCFCLTFFKPFAGANGTAMATSSTRAISSKPSRRWQSVLAPGERLEPRDRADLVSRIRRVVAMASESRGGGIVRGLLITGAAW